MIARLKPAQQRGWVSAWLCASRLRCGVVAACFTLYALASWGLNPNLPPSGNFDFSHWKLTLPVDSNGTNIGDAAEVQVAQMIAGYTNALYFFTAADGAMVFWCPVDGATTSGSTYPRSELREMLNPASTSVNWMGYGTHILTAQCKLTQIPSTKKVIIGQIHSFTGNAYPLLKLQYNNGTIEALFKFSPNVDMDTKFTAATGIALSNILSYQIKLVNGLLTASVNGNAPVGTNIFLTDPDWTNQTFYFKAGNYCQDNVGSAPEGASVSFYALTASHATNAPVITNQPVSVAVRAGSNATFTVGASGNPIFYNWRLNNTSLANATKPSLAITNVQQSDTGNYTVVVTNAAGSVTSLVATLSFPVAPSITGQPQSQTVPLGGNVTLNVTADGPPAPAFQWRNGSAGMSGQTNSSLTLTNFQKANEGNYDVVVSNLAGTVTSAAAALYLDSPLRLTTFKLTQVTNCAFTLIGPRFANFVVETSPDLTHWTAMETNVPATGIWDFHQTVPASSAMLFYRARQQ